VDRVLPLLLVDLPDLAPVADAGVGDHHVQTAAELLDPAGDQILLELESERAALDALTKRVVEAGLASWSREDNSGALIVRGQAHLLEDVTGVADLERLRSLFAALEAKEQLLKLVEAAEVADGVQIFIGAESDLFGLAGCSAVISPYRDSQRRLIGAIGVIGPSRINYARIIPLVEYTAKVIGRILG
ncbi:MAG: HrcA family transcriptional regulator, partial [Oceanibaculum sp.]